MPFSLYPLDLCYVLMNVRLPLYRYRCLHVFEFITGKNSLTPWLQRHCFWSLNYLWNDASLCEPHRNIRLIGTHKLTALSLSFLLIHQIQTVAVKYWPVAADYTNISTVIDKPISISNFFRPIKREKIWCSGDKWFCLCGHWTERWLWICRSYDAKVRSKFGSLRLWC